MVASWLSFVSLYGKLLRRSLSSADLSTQTIDIDDETTIHFWGPKHTAATPKHSLLLIQGFGPNSVWQWHQQAVFFARYFDVYIPDLIFFGKSTTTSSERSEVFQAESMVKLMEKLGVDRYYVAGTSYGGFVAYHMAEMWPERVEKVVIASSGVNMRMRDNVQAMKKANVEKIEDLMLPGTAAQVRKLMALAVYKQRYVPNFLLNDFIQKFYTENRKEKTELLKGLTIGRNDTVNLSPLQQGVLIVWGDHDNVFPLEKTAELKELLGKNARLEVIKNTSHLPQIENAGQFNKIVKSFLCESSW